MTCTCFYGYTYVERNLVDRIKSYGHGISMVTLFLVKLKNHEPLVENMQEYLLSIRDPTK